MINNRLSFNHIYRFMWSSKKTSEKMNNSLNINWETVLLIWNRWYKNLWDELILLWNIKLLLEQWKKISVASYEPEWSKKFFSQFIDVNQINFIPELPKGFRSLSKYVFKYRFKGFFKFFSSDSLILWWWEILTEENPWAYWYWKVSIWPFLFTKWLQKIFKTQKKSDLYIMWWAQIPQDSNRKKILDSLLKSSTACYFRDFQAVEEIQSITNKSCEFFMDTSFFAYDWSGVSTEEKKKREKPYVVINLNKNAEKFFDELVQDIKIYAEKWYRIYYVPIAKWHTIYYQDWQYCQRLEKALWENVEFALLDWESDFDYFTKMLKWAEKVFSSRLHLYLISSFMHCDIKVYPYQRKILKMKEVIDKII